MADEQKRRRKRPSKSGKSRLGLWSAIAIAVLLAAYVGVLTYSSPHVTGDKLRLDTFVQLALGEGKDLSVGDPTHEGEEGQPPGNPSQGNRIRNAHILAEDSFVVGTYLRSDGARRRYYLPYLKTLGSQERLVTVLLKGGVPTTVDQQFAKSLVIPATLLLPALIIVVIFIYLILSYRRGTGLFGIKSGARKSDREQSPVTFADVAGQGTAIAELRELVDFLTDPERFVELGAQIPKGILLYGPPGCGKTLVARALAGEAGASFYSISGSDFVELYVGVGAARVRDLFKEARENAPAIIFIDEIDTVGRRRGPTADGASQGEQEQSLNQILTEMDGFSPLDGIIVVGATNRPDVLDPALLRPGRFDRTVGLERPNEDDRLAILSVHAKSRRLAADADLKAIAHKAHGLTGADLANVVNEGALLAAREHKPTISQANLEGALERVLEAPERQRRLSMRDRSVGRRATGIDERVTLDDVAGQTAAKAELREIVEFLADPERFAELGAQMPKGVLLYGPPGCGKTLLAKAVAGEVNATFISVAASEFAEVFVGEGAGRMRDLFAEAKMMPPAIVFIDEIDALGTRRAQRGVEGNREQEQTLNQLLAELDGFEPRTGVILMAATNRPDMLDPALLRPGRFDRTVGLERPDEQGRLEILRLHARSRRLDSDHLPEIARRAHGMTGADLASVINEAALLSAREGKGAISEQELDQALERILEAPERQRRLALRDRSIGRRSTGVEERITFADVAGVDDAIEELAELKDYLAEPERFAAMGAQIPHGILLSGPPGCGKTLLAKAVAGEANAAFFSAAATEFVEVFVGEGAARVRDLFAEARAVAPAIVFIDEIDAVGARRPQFALDGNREREQTLNQLLVELDGFEARTGVILIAATNRPDILDPALVRPGRFDRQVEITLPDRAGRRAILALHARGKPLPGEADLDVIAGVTQGFSGADLANVVNEAALLATRGGLPEISRKTLEEAVERVLLGVGSRRYIMGDEERRAVAYHEAGHALVGLSLPGVTVPHKVSIIPRGRSLGHVWQVHEDERASHSRSTLINQMAMGLGGRAAEELVFGEPGSGAAEDLANVSTLARRMVCELGMSEALGGMNYKDEYFADSRSGLPGYSEDETKLIGAEARRLVDEAREGARQVLIGSRETLDRIAAALLERETLSADDLEQLVGRTAVHSG